VNITFFVAGTPAPKGSKKGFISRGAKKRVILVEQSSKEKPWAQTVHWSAREVWGHGPQKNDAAVTIVFYLSRPKYLKDTLNVRHNKTPDADKLGRSSLDALTNVLWLDDKQVVELHLFKYYANPGEPTGAKIIVNFLEDQCWTKKPKTTNNTNVILLDSFPITFS
jgi:Holliday junction resolvase RusA-like endonuclease